MDTHQSPSPPTSPQSEIFHIYFQLYSIFLRSASIRKFLIGFEMMAAVRKDLTPEQAAAILRVLSALHYIEDAQGL
ncbi:hypothetical protein L204_101603 [Cryptococcus depauperatus]|nr:hypothetical protein L204_04429 [Cryptococcus depauperatus CBS 7855]